jgi:hypothetical protein
VLGLRLDWLGTVRLSWRDLWVIVQQSPRTSALFKARNPDVPTADQELLRFVAVMIERLRLTFLGSEEKDLPTSWADLFESASQYSEADVLAGIEAFNNRTR